MLRKRGRIAAVIGAAMLVFGLAASAGIASGSGSSVESEPFIGEVSLVAFNYAPSGSVPADGRALTMNEYQLLFRVIGTTFGAEGYSFNVPKLDSPMPGLKYVIFYRGTLPRP